MTDDVALGDRVLVRARVVPKKEGSRGYPNWCLVRRWVREEVIAWGIVCGVRTVFEGKSELWPDVGYVFTPERHIKTFLVAVNMREIWHVLPEDMEKVREGDVSDDAVS